MNNSNEHGDFQNIIDMLESARDVRPSEASFKAFLERAPNRAGGKRLIKSPWFVSLLSVRGFAAAALAVLLIAGGVLVGNRVIEHNASNSSSDASIQQDLNSLDAELAGLSSDNANVDQIINQ